MIRQWFTSISLGLEGMGREVLKPSSTVLVFQKRVIKETERREYAMSAERVDVHTHSIFGRSLPNCDASVDVTAPSEFSLLHQSA